MAGKTLSEWAKANGLSYNQSYRRFLNKEIPNAQKLFNGSIIIEEPEPPKPIKEVLNFGAHTSVAADMQRENAAALITDPANRFANIDAGLLPYKYIAGGVGNSSCLSPRDTIILCAKAYFNFSVVRNVIELMVEFATSNLYLVGGNKKSQDFIYAWLKKINERAFQPQFFRDYFRFGNDFIYRYDIKLNKSGLADLTKTYGLSLAANKDFIIPSRYILLNPADIQLQCGAAYDGGKYQKVLTDYEKEALRNPRTPEDKEIFDSLPPEVKRAIKNNSGQVAIDLDMAKTYFLAYGKQGYEPFGVSIIFPVLDDLEWKAQMKKMDAAIARTVQQAILLVTTGTEPEKGGINPNNITTLQTIFSNESVGRVLISDYTTKAEFVVPDISDLLNPQKYEIINADIRDGLNNVLVGSAGEKFANKSVSLNVFVERLRAARQVYLNEFLNIEIKRVCEELGFKAFPEAKFEEINLKDDLEYSRIYTRLYEVGILTPDETIEAIETGKLPTKDQSAENHARFKESKDKGLYSPLTGGVADQKDLAQINNDAKLQQQKQKVAMQPAGRPKGKSGSPTKVKKKSKRMTPVGGSYSLKAFQTIMAESNKLETLVHNALQNKFKVKSLNEIQIQQANQIKEIIIANEELSAWENKVNEYVELPVDRNKDQVNEILEIAAEHGLDTHHAALLFHSKI